MVQAVSGGVSAEIKINGQPIKILKNSNNHLRGLHIVVINPISGKTKFAQAFDTSESPDSFDDFLFNNFPNGSIIAAACQGDDCVAHLSPEGKQWFINMGSKVIKELKNGSSSFVFLGVYGSGEMACLEKAGAGEDVSVT